MYSEEDKAFLESYKNVLYYAKGHYEKSEDCVRDLQLILKKECSCDLSTLEIYRTMVCLFLSAYRNNRYQIEDLFMQMFERYSMVYYTYDVEDSISYRRMIELILGKLSIVKVKDCDTIFLDMGEPDYTILGRPKHD